ncbi:TniQ family protein [Alkalibacillus sp. S2W]|uniref:TniQ family protein n=1 Tax=Alkalibacillus sp. S2W TaxID=3386553 RepID=UPI00398CA6A2
MSAENDRSILYHLDLCEKETSSVESLKSYFGRLAYYHKVYPSDLVNDIIIPLYFEESTFEEKTNFKIRVYKHHTEVFIKLAEILKNLTKNEELFGLEHYKDNEMLILKKKTRLEWCEICLKEMLDNEVVFEPFIWSVQYYSVCHKHNCYLESLCPHCESALPIMTSKYWPGYCTKCYQFLVGELSDYKPKVNDYEMFRSEQIRIIIDHMLSGDHKINYNSLLNSINQIYIGLFNESYDEFSEAISVNKSTIRFWISGKSKPNIDMISRICWVLDINIVEFVIDSSRCNLNNQKVEQLRGFAIKNQKHPEDIKAKIKTELEAILDKENPPPVKSVIQKYNFHSVHYDFPELCRAIKIKRKEYQRSKVKEMKQLIYDLSYEQYINFGEVDVNTVRIKVPYKYNYVSELNIYEEIKKNKRYFEQSDVHN